MPTNQVGGQRGRRAQVMADVVVGNRSETAQVEVAVVATRPAWFFELEGNDRCRCRCRCRGILGPRTAGRSGSHRPPAPSPAEQELTEPALGDMAPQLTCHPNPAGSSAICSANDLRGHGFYRPAGAPAPVYPSSSGSPALSRRGGPRSWASYRPV